MLSLMISYFRKRKDKNEDNPDYDDEKAKRRLPLRLLTILTTVAAIILFILTEDMTLPMVWADQWTIWHFVIAAVTVILALFSRKKYEEKELGAERA